uniref:Uncharacterized protein n=1 Tax=Molossus molossus TaxID=27622 RepID=A0A7J8CRP4_MOLMO|nr:hypothetical protein HJG59_009742 [Molossus molossus]
MEIEMSQKPYNPTCPLPATPHTDIPTAQPLCTTEKMDTPNPNADRCESGGQEGITSQAGVIRLYWGSIRQGWAGTTLGSRACTPKQRSASGQWWEAGLSSSGQASGWSPQSSAIGEGNVGLVGFTTGGSAWARVGTSLRKSGSCSLEGWMEEGWKRD